MVQQNSTREHIHFIGIGGIGMSGIAKMFLSRKSAYISGSDLSGSPLLDDLEKMGARIYTGHNAENIHGATMIVKSSAIRDDNPEIVEAKKLGIPILHRSKILAMLFNSGYGIAVAGTHGKTTTSSMMTVVLHNAMKSPSYVVGGVVNSLDSNSGDGGSDLFVIEADESDGSLVNYTPSIEIITNTELDHLDYYNSIDDIHRVFAQFINNTKPNGCVVWCAECNDLRRIVDTVPVKDNIKFISYGISAGDYRAEHIEHNGYGSTFHVLKDGAYIGSTSLNIPGRHNILNALSIVAACSFMGLSFEEIKVGLESFEGVKRRFQILKRDNQGLPFIIDDYGHHPTEIHATLTAANELKNGRKLIAAFQPHRFTRTQALAKEFGKAFDFVDELYLLPIYPASEKPIPGVDSGLIANEIHKNRKDLKVIQVRNLSELESILRRRLNTRNTFLLTLGAGDVYIVSHLLANELMAK